MIEATLDTNVLASAFLSPEPPPGRLLAAWRQQRYTLVLSDYILAELARTLRRPYFSGRLFPEQQAANLGLLYRQAAFTQINVEVSGVATHPEDDLILATALSAGVDYLVTGDRRLIRHLGGSYQTVRLVTPADFLSVLGVPRR